MCVSGERREERREKKFLHSPIEGECTREGEIAEEYVKRRRQKRVEN